MKYLENLSKHETWIVAFLATCFIYFLLKSVFYFVKSKVSNLKNKYPKAFTPIEIALTKTSNIFLLIVALNIVLNFLELSHDKLLIVQYITKFYLFYQVGLWLDAFIVSYSSQWIKATNTPISSHGLIITTFRFILWSLITFLFIENIGIDVTALVAGLGVGGIAVALAVQNILGDLFCSISILLDKPFEVGDFIVVGDLKGSVEKIGIRSTRVRSLTGEQIIVANSDLTKGQIKNYKRMNERRIEFKLGVIYQTEYEKLIKIPTLIKQAVESQKNTRFDRAHFLSYGDSALIFEIVYFVLSSDFNIYADTHHLINLDIYKKFEAEKINFAYPTQTLFVENIR